MISSCSLDLKTKKTINNQISQHQFTHSVKSQPKIAPKKSNHQQQFQQIIACHICYCASTNIIMCPYCSKVFCQPCIKKSLFIKPQCPHCRKHIKDVKVMANCSRFVNQIKSIVQEVLQQKQKQNFRCQQHDVALNYYCTECQKSVCCQCKMFGSHGEHTLIQVQKKFQQKYSIVRSILAQLKIQIKQKEQLMNKLQRRLDEVDCLQKTQNMQINKLQNQFNKNLQTFTTENQNSKQFMDKIESLTQQVSRYKKQLRNQVTKMKKQSKLSIKPQFKLKFENDISSIQQKIKQLDNDQKNKQKNLLKGLIPEYEYTTFVISNFPEKQKQKTVIYSEQVTILNKIWRLKVYPNGNQSVEGVYISIFLQMVAGNNTQKQSVKSIYSNKNTLNTYQYLIQIMNVQTDHTLSQKIVNNKNRKRIVRQYTSSFQPGQSWGYNKYVKLEELQRQNLINNVNNNQLAIKYGIRRPDYYSQFKNLQQELQQIQKQSLIELHSIEILYSNKSNTD